MGDLASLRVLEDEPVQAGCSARRLSRELQPSLPAPGIISNGVIKLGVNAAGNLNVPGGLPIDVPTSTGISEPRVGLRYIFDDGSESEATSFGCECEGWGIFADGDRAWANDAQLPWRVDLSTVTFNATATTAASSVVSPGGNLRISHDFHPSLVLRRIICMR
jgi:hypothetical protein